MMTEEQRRQAAQASARKYYLLHRAQVIAYNRRYQQDHPWVQRTNYSRRKAKQRGGAIAAVDEQQIFERDRWTCQLCGQPVDKLLAWPDPLSKSLDHIIPLRFGGPHTAENVQLVHLVCNSRKGLRVLTRR
jgi:5-methylcytosine-specific restriction endonuclease McrA